MPAKTKYRNRRNKTRRHNNKTRRYRHRPTSKLAKLMKGGQETIVDNEQPTTEQPTTSDASTVLPNVDIPTSSTEPLHAESNGSQEGSEQESVSTETNQVEESKEQNIDIPLSQEPLPTPPSETTIAPEPAEPITTVEPEYKYNNLIAGDEPVEGIEKIPISKEDLTPEDNVFVLGTQVPNTNYYIDSQGVRREFKEGITSILKVNIVDLPTLEGNIEPSAEGENRFLTEANTALTALGTMLQQIYGILPEYMEVDFEGKRYLISKQNPYIVVDNEQFIEPIPEQSIESTAEPVQEQPAEQT